MQQNITTDTTILKNIAKVANIQVELEAEFGTTQLAVQEAIEYDSGTVIKLDNFTTEPINIFVNGILIAKAKIVAIEGHYGIKIVEIIDKDSSGEKNG